MRLALLALLVVVVASEKCSSHDVCGDGKFCAGDDGKKVGQCRVCAECEENHDAVDGKCPCGKGKGKKGGGGGGGGGEGGEPAKGPACKKHKDCPKTDFCSTNGCLKCKMCEEHDDSVSGKCPCGPARKRDKGGKGGKGSCSKNKGCSKGQFCMGRDNGKHACAPCSECHQDHDSVEGKCLNFCQVKARTDPEDEKKGVSGDDEGSDGGGEPATGPACKKHKDCPKTDFCSTDGCLKCKRCEEHDMSANGKCPCGPARKRDKKKKAKDEL